jgi:signal transduction histidine kinase
LLGITLGENHPAEARFLKTLQELLQLPALKLQEALGAAAQRVTEALGCDKVDAFLVDESKQTLRAIGTSDTPMGRQQHALGLDILPIANGGRAVDVFKTGKSHFENHSELDSGEVRGLVAELGVRSAMNVPLEVHGVRRGVISAVSAQSEFFSPSDLVFLESVALWVGMLVHRAELAERTRDIEAKEARRAGADELITVLAHDLRNHLHPLMGRLQLMRLHVTNGKPPQTSEIDAALRSVHRLSRLTSDLLDLKRLDEGLFSLNLAAVDLMLLAKETGATLGTAAVPVRVNGPSTLVVIADGDRLRQALENLVANAVKYSPAGKPVHINLSELVRSKRTFALLEVVDEGPGIAPELLSSLFDRFASSRDSPGLGLGLYLAHRIALVHEGELSVESKPGVGTVFRFLLPLELPAESSRGREGD